MRDKSNSALLAYFVKTEPDSFVPGLPGHITIAIAPSLTGSVICRTVTFTVPYGKGSTTGIFDEKPVLKYQSSEDWEVGISQPADNPNESIITLDNKVLGGAVDHTFTFKLLGTVNQITKPSIITIMEESAHSTNDTRPVFSNRKGQLSVNPLASSAPLSITSFLAEKPTKAESSVKSSSIIPITQVAEAEPIRLVWVAPNAKSFELYNGNTKCTLDAKTTGVYLVEKGLSNTTTFTLIAHAEDQTVVSTLTIVVVNPIVAGLAVTGTTYLGDDPAVDKLVIKADTANSGTTTLTGEVTASNTVNLNGTLNANEGATISKTATFKNGLKVDGSEATLNKGLTVNGLATLNNGLKVDGSEATLNEGLTANGLATMNKGLTVKGDSSVANTLIDGDLTVTGKGGRTLTASVEVTNGLTLDLPNCFPSDYHYFEIVLTCVAPSVNFAHLRAVFHDQSGYVDSVANYSGSLFGNDAGSNGCENYYTLKHFKLWPDGKDGPEAGTGISGTLTLPDMIVSSLPTFSGLLYAPRAYGSTVTHPSGCQVMVSGAAVLADLISGIRFFFDTGTISGRVSVYGYN